MINSSDNTSKPIPNFVNNKKGAGWLNKNIMGRVPAVPIDMVVVLDNLKYLRTNAIHAK